MFYVGSGRTKKSRKPKPLTVADESSSLHIRTSCTNEPYAVDNGVTPGGQGVDEEVSEPSIDFAETLQKKEQSIVSNG